MFLSSLDSFKRKFQPFFQAFKFPDSMNVHFQCVVQVCRGSCPNPQCGGGQTIQTTNSVLPSAVPNSDGYGAPIAPTVDRYVVIRSIWMDGNERDAFYLPLRRFPNRNQGERIFCTTMTTFFFLSLFFFSRRCKLATFRVKGVKKDTFCHSIVITAIKT